MPRYHEQFGRPLNADPGTRGVVESPTRGSSTKDLWAAFLGGITLIVVSALGACIATRSRCTAPSALPANGKLRRRTTCQPRSRSVPRRSAFGRAGDLMQQGLELRADAAQLLAVHLGELLQDAVALRAKP